MNAANPEFDPVHLHRQATQWLGRHRASTPLCVREEIAQEAICRLLEARREGRRLHHPGGWIATVCLRVATDRWRRDRRLSPLPPAWAETAVAPSIDPMVRVDAARLLRLLDDAPATYRETVQLIEIDGLSAEDLITTDRATDPGGWDRERATVYKRHARALDWIRHVVVHGGQDRRRLAQTRSQRAEIHDQIAHFLVSRGGWHRRGEIDRALRPPGAQLRRALEALRREGRIEMRGLKRGTEYRYLPPSEAT